MAFHAGASHIALCALTVLACFSLASAHGFIRSPKGRQLIAFETAPATVGYCPHCYNAGGISVVSGGGTYTWPAGVHGICGDRADGPRTLEVGGSAYFGVLGGTYTEGSVMQVDLEISSFHQGRIQMRICRVVGADLDAAEKQGLTDDCLNEHVLVQANVPGAQNPGEQYFYLGADSGGATIFTSYYQLPTGLTCDGVTSRCILQWYWTTGNSCTPPATPAVYASSVGCCLTCYSCYDGTCGVNGRYPEEFWNCADIAILAAGTPLPSLSPKASPSPSPKASPSPSPSAKASPSPSPSPKTSPTASPASPTGIPSGTFALGSDCTSGDASCFCTWKGRNGRFADPGSGCFSYYECNGDQQAYRTCPSSGLLFSDTAASCDLDYKVACVSAVLGSTPSSPLALGQPVNSPQATASPSPVSPVAQPSPQAGGVLPQPSPKAVGAAPLPSPTTSGPLVTLPDNAPSPAKQGGPGSRSPTSRGATPSPASRSPAPAPQLKRPPTPVLLSKTVGQALVEIKVKPAAGAAAYAIRCPQVARPAKQIKTITTKAAVTFRLTGLKPKTQHRCFIAARNRAGSSRELAVTFTTKPKQ